MIMNANQERALVATYLLGPAPATVTAVREKMAALGAETRKPFASVTAVVKRGYLKYSSTGDELGTTHVELTNQGLRLVKRILQDQATQEGRSS